MGFRAGTLSCTPSFDSQLAYPQDVAITNCGFRGKRGESLGKQPEDLQPLTNGNEVSKRKTFNQSVSHPCYMRSLLQGSGFPHRGKSANRRGRMKNIGR